MHTGYGVIASGVARNYLADALQDDSGVAVLELGMTWPLPEKMLLAFLSACKSVLILEEGEPFLEKIFAPLPRKTVLKPKLRGKDKELGVCGEYSTTLVARRLARFMGAEEPKAKPCGRAGRPAEASAKSLSWLRAPFRLLCGQGRLLAIRPCIPATLAVTRLAFCHR